ncbi:hypothetical protein Taro_038637 [Colocasia esculenta]|uniref:Uncharacterized protein n=1 Tax=Colocasia esculenta TaxID=4460 RepID=A0A843W789_COLES|nr:hypothetical protein [Colocasia esculenta]
MYNSSKGVRVFRSDDTDLDGTAQVLGQSPELTTWLTENLGHPTGEMQYYNQKELKGIVPYLKTHLNLLNPPDSYQTLRELLRRLHLAPAFPCPIRHHLTFHDPPTSLLQPLEAVGKQGHENRARERENGVRELPLGRPIFYRSHRLASTLFSLREPSQ